MRLRDEGIAVVDEGVHHLRFVARGCALQLLHIDHVDRPHLPVDDEIGTADVVVAGPLAREKQLRPEIAAEQEGRKIVCRRVDLRARTGVDVPHLGPHPVDAEGVVQIRVAPVVHGLIGSGEDGVVGEAEACILCVRPVGGEDQERDGGATNHLLEGDGMGIPGGAVECGDIRDADATTLAAEIIDVGSADGVGEAEFQIHTEIRIGGMGDGEIAVIVGEEADVAVTRPDPPQ